MKTPNFSKLAKKIFGPLPRILMKDKKKVTPNPKNKYELFCPKCFISIYAFSYFDTNEKMLFHNSYLRFTSSSFQPKFEHKQH